MTNIYWKDEKPRFFSTLVDTYQKYTGKTYYNNKTIYDKVNPKECNICVINLQPDNVLWGKPFEHWDQVQWALDNNMKVILDYSWENMCLNKSGCETQFIHANKKFILQNNIKIITQAWDSSIDEDYDVELRKSVINFSMFEFNMRLMHELENPEFRLLSSPSKHKKYLLNYIPGDIRKHHSGMMLQLLLENLEKDDIFYSTVIGDYFQENVMTWDLNNKFIDSLLEYLKEVDQSLVDLFKRTSKNKDNIIKHSPFDTYYGYEIDISDTKQERRIPPGVYESHFSLIQEVGYRNHFYTEKTFKHIIAEKPFLIVAATGTNHGLKNLGYEIFEELFDYSYDKHNRNDWQIKLQCYNGVRDNINILKDNRDLFDQKSVREKTTHNRHNLLQRTNIDMFEKELERVLTS